VAENEPLAQVAPRAIELLLRLGDVRSIKSGRCVGQTFEREEDRRPGIACLARLARLIRQEP
jgi:hypothetical protein